MDHGLEINSEQILNSTIDFPCIKRTNSTLDEQQRSVQWRPEKNSAEKDILEQTTAAGTQTAHKPFVIKQSSSLCVTAPAP